jgi:hypothetical protein
MLRRPCTSPPTVRRRGRRHRDPSDRAGITPGDHGAWHSSAGEVTGRNRAATGEPGPTLGQPPSRPWRPHRRRHSGSTAPPRRRMASPRWIVMYVCHQAILCPRDPAGNDAPGIRSGEDQAGAMRRVRFSDRHPGRRRVSFPAGSTACPRRLSGRKRAPTAWPLSIAPRRPGDRGRSDLGKCAPAPVSPPCSDRAARGGPMSRYPHQ